MRIRRCQKCRREWEPVNRYDRICPGCGSFDTVLKAGHGLKPHNADAGYIASRRNRLHRGWMVIYNAAEAQLDTYDGKYAVVCTRHSTILNTSSIPKARGFMKSAEFCEEYMAMERGEITAAEASGDVIREPGDLDGLTT